MSWFNKLINNNNNDNNHDTIKINSRPEVASSKLSRLHERIKDGLDIAVSPSSSDITSTSIKTTTTTTSSSTTTKAIMTTTIATTTITADKYKNQFKIVNEVSCFDGVFPVDIVIYRNDKIVAILEIDGPHHYRFVFIC